MNKRTKAIIGLGFALCATLALGACATRGDTTIEDHIDRGFNLFIEYDRNGGVVSNRDGVELIDHFRSSGLDSGVKLDAPGDANRGVSNASASRISRDGYRLLGWYRERTDRVENDQAVDENGELASVSGKPQAYMYSGLWNFATDRVTRDMVETKHDSRGKEYFTFKLYAAWAPEFTYAFYNENEAGEWVQYGSCTLPAGSQSIPTPTWDEEEGELNYGTVPVYSTEDKQSSLTGMYADPGKTTVIADNLMDNIVETSIPHSGKDDLTTGTATEVVKKVYTTWRDGVWYRIKTAEQFSKHLTAAGNYDLYADLDFSEVAWNGSLMQFSGSINGGGHTVSNINVTQANSIRAGGVFGAITAEASIRDVTFADVSFTVGNATTSVGGLYGLFAGSIDDKATITGVSVSGLIYLGDLYPGANFNNFTVGLVCGNCADINLSAKGITADIDVRIAKVDYLEDAQGNYPVEGWAVLAQKNEDGTLTITKNPDVTKDPNPQE